MPELATCQAASEPARPAPMICTDSEVDLVPVMARQVARFRAQWNAQGTRQIRQRPQRGGRYPFVRQSADSGSALIGSGCNARKVPTIKADIGQLATPEL